jgi:hypothetical protein
MSAICHAVFHHQLMSPQNETIPFQKAINQKSRESAEATALPDE